MSPVTPSCHWHLYKIRTIPISKIFCVVATITTVTTITNQVDDG